MAKGYEVFVVIRDKDYPMADESAPWEAGWFLAYDFNGEADYELVVLPIAETLASPTR